MEELTEIYNDLLDKGVMMYAGNYHLSGDTDAATIKLGDNFGVFLDVNKIRTLRQEKEAVVHEWAHIVEDATYCVDAPPAIRQKAELRAERRTIKKLLPVEQLRAAMQNGITEVWELAEFFNVSESLILDAVEFYTGPCGLKL